MEDRRADSDLTRQRFADAVQEAAASAAQQVAQLHRRRLVLQSFCAAMAVSATVVVVGMLIVSSNNQTFSRNNAIYDCRLFERAARIMGGFVQSDADLRAQQNRQGLSRELSADLQKIIPRTTLVKLAAVQQHQIAAAVALWRQQATQLTRLGGTSCQSHLGG
jgi:hypothetical protein